MHKRILGLVMLTLAFVVLTGAHRPTPIYQQKPLSVPEGMSLDQVSEVVTRALSGRGWVIDEKVPAEDGESVEITSSLHVRVHSITIKIAIDTNQVHMTYVSSVNMRYKESKKKGPLIHPKYTTWLKNLELDVNTAFNVYR